MSGFEILGGIGLTLFAVRFLRKGLDRLFGGNLIAWLSRGIKSRFAAFGGGIGVGIVAPSSTGIALLLTQMLATAKLPASNTLAALLGANVGITIAVQLVSFHLQDYAGLFIIAGILAFQFLQRDFFRGIGQCILALGFIFLAIRLIGNGAQGFSSSAELKETIHLLRGHPLLVIVAVGLLAFLLQSSTATIGFGLGLSASGLLETDIMIPWVLGTTLGLAFTLLLAGWSTLEGRRLGIGNLITKLVCMIPFLLFPAAALKFSELWPGSLSRQVAVFYTEFNLIAGLAVLPFLSQLERLVRFLIPDQNEDIPFGHESFLDDRLLESPSLALARATRETLRMLDRVRVMLEMFWGTFPSGNIEMAKRIQKEDDRIDQLNRTLSHYLSKIAGDKSEADTQWQIALFTFSNEIESAGDLIDKHLCDLLIKQRSECVVLEQENLKTLSAALEWLLEQIESASGLLTSRNSEDAKRLLAKKQEINDWYRDVQRKHYEDLSLRLRPAASNSAFFLDYLNALRRINSHIASIGYFLRRSS